MAVERDAGDYPDDVFDAGHFDQVVAFAGEPIRSSVKVDGADTQHEQLHEAAL